MHNFHTFFMMCEDNLPIVAAVDDPLCVEKYSFAFLINKSLFNPPSDDSSFVTMGVVESAGIRI